MGSTKLGKGIPLTFMSHYAVMEMSGGIYVSDIHLIKIQR